jgi:23S rRNA (guanosine2251-2'-O)-methyltransferase
MRDHKAKIYIYGKHALGEALLNAPQVIRKVFLSHEASGDKELKFLLSKNKVPTAILKNTREGDRMVGQDTAHQGVIAIADPSSLVSDFKDFMRNLKPTPKTMFVLLDELTDPHNVGAIIRSAAALGATGVIMPDRRQAPITGSVVKTSAGMVFRTPILSVSNANYAVDFLKDLDFKVYALAASGRKNVSEAKFDSPSLFVIGNEGKGVREKTLERCDEVLSIPMHPKCESLNASVSAAIVLHQWSAQHPEALN